MNKQYSRILIIVFVSLLIIYFIKQVVIIKIMNENDDDNKLTKYEAFTPKINSMYRPYVRHANKYYESFISNYGPNVVFNKLKKWNIY